MNIIDKHIKQFIDCIIRKENNMRLWHKDLIKFLPRQQLLSQWRELSAIVGSIQKNGTPNHILVNKVLDYPLTHFEAYTILIDKEMVKRGYKVADSVRDKIYNFCYNSRNTAVNDITYEELYSGWHNERYLKQCILNLEEKFDCNGITESEWKLIEDNINLIK